MLSSVSHVTNGSVRVKKFRKAQSEEDLNQCAGVSKRNSATQLVGRVYTAEESARTARSAAEC